MQLHSAHRYLLQQSGLVCLGLVFASGAAAAEWTTSAGVAPAITYTDNVCLSKDNEQGEWIALVTPDVSVQANGNRANLNLAASMEINSLSDGRIEDLGCNPSGFGNNRKQFTPELYGKADAILVEQWLFIDASANTYQNEITPFASGGGDSLNRTGNTNTTYDYNISPYVARRFKDVAELNLRYTWDDQYNTQDIVGDSSQQTVNFLLGGVPGVSKFSWGLQGDYSKTSYADSPGREVNNDSELKSAQLNLGYQLNQAWQVNGFVGNEWNDFVSSRDVDGDYWDAGLRWTPNARTTVEAGNGNRFYGNSPRFSINYRHKRSVLRANYSKTLTYNRDIRSLGSTQPPDPEFAPPGDISPGQTTLSNSPILDERFTLGYSFQGRRTRVGLNAFQSDQTTEDLSQGDVLTGFNETQYRGVSANASRSLSSVLSVSSGLSWSEQQPKGSANANDVASDSEEWTFNLGVRRRLGINTNLSFDYTYTDRQSERAFNEYTENRFTLTLRVSL